MEAAPVLTPVKMAEFGPSRLSDVACFECYDTGLAGGSQYTAGSRCEACRGPSMVKRLVRALRAF